MTLSPALPQAHSQPLFPLPDWPSLPPVTPHNPAQEAVFSAVNTLRRTPGTSPHYGDHYGDITLWDMHTLAHHPAQFLWAVRDSTSVCWLYHDTAGQELLDYYSGRRGLHFFWYHAGTMRPLALSDVPAAFQQLPAAYELSSNHGHFQLRQDRPGSAQPAAAATTTTTPLTRTPRRRCWTGKPCWNSSAAARGIHGLNTCCKPCSGASGGPHDVYLAVGVLPFAGHQRDPVYPYGQRWPICQRPDNAGHGSASSPARYRRAAQERSGHRDTTSNHCTSGPPYRRGA